MSNVLTALTLELVRQGRDGKRWEACEGTLFKTKEQPVATNQLYPMTGAQKEFMSKPTQYGKLLPSEKQEELFLKPCPFCGNKNLKLERLHKQKYLGQGNVADIWGIACHGTQPDGKPCYVELAPGQLEAVVSRWNTRV